MEMSAGQQEVDTIADQRWILLAQKPFSVEWVAILNWDVSHGRKIYIFIFYEWKIRSCSNSSPDQILTQQQLAGAG